MTLTLVPPSPPPSSVEEALERTPNINPLIRSTIEHMMAENYEMIRDPQKSEWLIALVLALHKVRP